jgi:hypothetical protein
LADQFSIPRDEAAAMIAEAMRTIRKAGDGGAADGEWEGALS